jgi:hypothetical protein
MNISPGVRDESCFAKMHCSHSASFWETSTYFSFDLKESRMVTRLEEDVNIMCREEKQVLD